MSVKANINLKFYMNKHIHAHTDIYILFILLYENLFLLGRVGTHQHQGKREEGKTWENTEEKERDRGT